MFVYVLNDAGLRVCFRQVGVLDSRLLFGGYAVGSEFDSRFMAWLQV